jgi:hypothetical protein
MLKHDLPIYFSVIRHYSNGAHFETFMIDEVLPRLSRGDTVVVDNQNYHVMGK